MKRAAYARVGPAARHRGPPVSIGIEPSFLDALVASPARLSSRLETAASIAVWRILRSLLKEEARGSGSSTVVIRRVHTPELMDSGPVIVIER